MGRGLVRRASRRTARSRTYDFLAAPLDEVQESFERLGVAEGVRFVPGFFEATLPPLAGGRWAIVRLDADTYEPTKVALQSLYPGLAVGGYLVLDDYGSFPECRRAVDEFREQHGITEPIERIDPTGVRWRRESEAPLDVEVEAATPPRAVARERSTHVPTEREVELARELADAEAAIGLRPWLRRKWSRQMIAFASSITDGELYRQAAEPGIRLAAEPDSLVIANAAAGSIFRSYNLIMDSVADREDLEALVLLHQDAELASPGFCATLRDALSDPEVGVVGCVGAVGVRSIAWWEGSVTWASFTHRYRELGGGELPALSWDEEGAAGLRQDRRGRHRRRLRARALAVGGAQRALRRVARAPARLRLRLLPSGPRRRPQGGDRGLQRHPSPLARAGQQPGDVARRAYARRREVGRGQRRRRRVAPARAPGRGRGLAGPHPGGRRDAPRRRREGPARA